MKVACIGGGPASLYFSILAKKSNPEWDIEVYERNPANVTWGFGVVFSDETLEGFGEADPETQKVIMDSFVQWSDIDIHFKGQVITSRGHGFAGMPRLKLLQILEARAIRLGVPVRHNTEITGLERFADADLIIAGDGVTSFVRSQFEEEFETEIVMRPNRFVWMATDKDFDAFTFYFNENEHGLWRAHCYRYIPGASTFIVECTEESWRKAGLENAAEKETVAHCRKVFEKELCGHRLMTNKSIWRSFPRVKNGKYFYKNIVLLGDALHTAHFSVGSGTKLAMEDAVALNDALNKYRRLEDAQQAFQEERQPTVESLQRAAQASMEWFENTERYYHAMEPIQFAFSLLTRSLRITHTNLKLRDPDLVARVDDWVANQAGLQSGTPRNTRLPPPIFTPFRLRDMVLENRVAVSPMCMYSANDGTVGDWHLVHLGCRAMGGAGLVMTEGTGISREGRISPGCAGMYKDEHVAAWKRIVDFVHENTGAKIGMQLCHAGRKASTKVLWEGEDDPLDEDNWPIIAPSSIPYKEISQAPREMTREDMDAVKADFVAAAERANAAEFDLIELHAAHGYLISTFLSPRTNRRTDEYGGAIESRLRYPLEVFKAMRAAFPAHKPMSVRISATDWVADGFTPEEAVVVAKALKREGCDILDVSAGQVVTDQDPIYGRLFQTPFSERVRLEADMPTMTVGNIQSFADANSIIAGGRADICVIARMHLFDPYWTRHAANEFGYPLPMPKQYKAVEVYTPRWV
ncbi:MAG: bifunctional salicylyl-CoA 5-hydroxylase/oxidoreductase [Nitrospinota bacterium]